MSAYNTSVEAGGSDEREIVISPGDEFRFENVLTPGDYVKVELKRGLAELYGSEFAEKREYKISGRKAAIFTWHGCILKMRKTIVEYIGEKPPMHRCLNLHLALETKRTEAEESDIIGPRVLIIGPSDVGKTSLVKTLVNYAVRRGRKLIYVNTDTSESPVMLPGTVTATTITRPISIEDEMGQSSSSSGALTLAYYYGYLDPLEKEFLYKRVCSKLAQSVLRKLQDKSDTSNLVAHAHSYEMLDHLVNVFDVNCIVSVGNERLYSELGIRYKNRPGISIVKVPKSGGMCSIRQYFYGTPNEELTAYSSGVVFDNVQIYRYAEETHIPSSALPLGTEQRKPDIRFVKVDSLSNLSNAILALTYLSIDSYEDPSPDEIVESSIAGFVHVSEIDNEKGRLTLLSPSPGRLPKNYFIMGSLKWLEI